MRPASQARMSTRRRLALFGLVVITLVVVFAVRLVDMQIVRAAEINQEAAGRRSIVEQIASRRGDILDANGQVLATDVERFNITADPRHVGPFRRIIKEESTGDSMQVQITAEQAVNEIAGLTGADPEAMLDTLESNKERNYALLVKGVDVEVLREVRSLGIPWVYSEPQPARAYPNGAVAGNLTGFLGTDGPGAGVELYLNQCLAGEHGSATYARGGDGVRLPGSTIVTKEARNGADVQLTIDLDLQWNAQQQVANLAKSLGADWGIAIVMEVETGKLRAVAEYPSVDPNNPGATDPSTWTSRSFTAPFEPGSVMKAPALAALLDEGVISVGTRVEAPYHKKFEEHVQVTDAFWHGNLKLTSAGVLAVSSNVGMFELAKHGTARELDKRLRLFGVGAATEVGFQGESNGLLHDLSSIDRQTRFNVVIGQGVSVTAVQLASMYQAIGNEGVRMPVTLVEGCRHEDGTVTEVPTGEGKRVVSAQAAKATQLMLETTVREGALRAEASISGYRIGAKTGTAQVAERGVYGNKRITSVVGLAPVGDPKYVVAVIMGNPDNKASVSVAPGFRKIMSQVLKTYRVEPSTAGAGSLSTNW